MKCQYIDATIDCGATDTFLRSPELDVKQRQQTAEQMQSVRAGENVEETAARDWSPRNVPAATSCRQAMIWPATKRMPENRGSGPPVTETSVVSSL